jgi:hypothetical protein
MPTGDTAKVINIILDRHQYRDRRMSVLRMRIVDNRGTRKRVYIDSKLKMGEMSLAHVRQSILNRIIDSLPGPIGPSNTFANEFLRYAAMRSGPE